MHALATLAPREGDIIAQKHVETKTLSSEKVIQLFFGGIVGDFEFSR
jgi:hypothetical protein